MYGGDGECWRVEKSFCITNYCLNLLKIFIDILPRCYDGLS